MILLTHGQIEDITVTLNEKRTLDAGYYLFVFTHILTRNVINKIYNFLDDDSAYPERFNEFELDTVIFNNEPIGMWTYEVYEQASSSNTNVTGLTQVEKGIMRLLPVTEFAFEKYNEPTTFKAYAG